MNHTPSLSIKNLTVSFPCNQVVAIKNINFVLKTGEVIGLIGESGSGKSTLAQTLLGLKHENGQYLGEIRFGTHELLSMNDTQLNKSVRWSRIALVFQNSNQILNPVLSIEAQLRECLSNHTRLPNTEIQTRIHEQFNRVGLHLKWLSAYPHQLSGGMRQKVLIAMALICEPDYLVIDEPTASLDRSARKEIIDLLRDLIVSGPGILLISHDIALIMALCQTIMVIYDGMLVERGNRNELLKTPHHPYTRGLLSSSPDISLYRDLWGIPESARVAIRGCPFQFRCHQSTETCTLVLPDLTKLSSTHHIACTQGGLITRLKATQINKTYKYGHNKTVNACVDCNFEILAGEVVALIGETGSGKSTLASIISGLLKPDSGEIVFNERVLAGNSETSRYGGLQIVFQDPTSALNEHFTIEQAVKEPLDICKEGTNLWRLNQVKVVLKLVGLSDTPLFIQRHVFTLSGGQRQRLAIARALIMNPCVLIADEITSALDPSTQANIIRLLKGLQNSCGFSMLFVTHNLALARKIADRLLVMKNGYLHAGSWREQSLNEAELT